MKRRDFFGWLGATTIGGFLMSRVQRRMLPEVIDAEYPESMNIEVLDHHGRPMLGVRSVNTRTMMAEQYRRRPPTIDDRERYANARMSCPPTCIVLDSVTEKPVVDVVPYARLRLRDGRDVVKVLGV
jgi:hypothetical protein